MEIFIKVAFILSLEFFIWLLNVLGHTNNFYLKEKGVFKIIF